MAEVISRENEAVLPLPWASRASSMAYLPGGSSRQVETLRLLFSKIDSEGGSAGALLDLGDGVDRPLRDVMKQVAPAGLVTRVDRDRFVISDEARRWLVTGDVADLLAVFHRHVRYIGELLQQLRDGPRTVRDLVNVAAAEYQLQWATLDQARRRVSWLTCLGLTEYKTTSHVGLTELGQQQLAHLRLGGPDREAVEPAAIDAPESSPLIASVVGALTPESLASRNPVLGYIPRGSGEADVVQAITSLVNACSPQITRAGLLAYAQSTFSVSESSFGAVLTTLTKSGLIEQVGFNIYSPTPNATAWLENSNALDLALLLHLKFAFFLEIIPLLTEFDRAPELAKAAAEHYGLQRTDVGGVRTRIQVLKAAGLIQERANWRYRATPLGERIAQQFPLQSISEVDDLATFGSEAAELSASPSPAALLARELKDAATASDTPVRLEKAVADAFAFLGFEARHIGGSGRTDVLATVDGPEMRPVRVILDAKAARSGFVNEGAVSFDTLNDHKKEHQADFVALVGPNFESGRILARAERHGVALITVDDLGRILRRHEITPRSAGTFIKLVDPRPDARRELEVSWSQAERRMALLGQIVAVLAQEAREADEVTHGALSSEQIYLIVRDDIDPRPSPKDIEDVLRLLEDPLVASVSRTPSTGGRPSGYYLVDSPSLVSAKLGALAASLAHVETEA